MPISQGLKTFEPKPINAAFDSPKFALSGYVYSHDVEEGMVALYTPFEHEVTFLPEATFQAVTDGRFAEVPQDILADLIQRRFVVQPGFDQQVLKSYEPPAMDGFFLLQLVVIQTCNLGCTYCVVEADQQTLQLPKQPQLSRVPQTRMGKEVGRAAVDVFFRNLESFRPPVAKVIFYGGEPLMNKPLIIDTVKYIRNKPRYPGQAVPVDILCFTNGLIYDKALVDFFKENQVSVGLSLDGKKEHNDKVRKRLDGKGSFDQVVKSFKRYQDAGVSIGISCAIGTHNYEDLEEIAEYFAVDLNVKQMQLIPMQQTPDANNEDYVDMKDAAQSAWNAFRKLRSLGVEEGLALRRITRFAEGKFHHRDCGAVGGQLVVAPDGSIGPCQNATVSAPETFSGNVLEEGCDPMSLASMLEWSKRQPVNMPDCHGCSAIALCGGGCPYNALVTKGSIWKKDPQQCNYMDNFIGFLLEDVWDRYKAIQAQPVMPGMMPATQQSSAPMPGVNLGY